MRNQLISLKLYYVGIKTSTICQIKKFMIKYALLKEFI